MRRRLFNILAAVSIMLCVAMAALWVRSYWYGHAIVLWLEPQWGLIVAADWGNAYFFSAELKPAQAGHIEISGTEAGGDDEVVYEWNVLGLKFAHDDSRLFNAIVVPFWMLVIPLLAFNVHLMWKRRKRRFLGLCLLCGYDLRASTDRCPECGTAIPHRSPTAGATT